MKTNYIKKYTHLWAHLLFRVYKLAPEGCHTPMVRRMPRREQEICQVWAGTSFPPPRSPRNINNFKDIQDKVDIFVLHDFYSFCKHVNKRRRSTVNFHLALFFYYNYIWIHPNIICSWWKKALKIFSRIEKIGK